MGGWGLGRVLRILDSGWVPGVLRILDGLMTALPLPALLLIHSPTSSPQAANQFGTQPPDRRSISNFNSDCFQSKSSSPELPPLLLFWS